MQCIDNSVIGDITLLDNANYCEHKFLISVDGKTETYLGCRQVIFGFAQIMTDKEKIKIGEELNLTFTVFPSLLKICDPYVTVLYEPLQRPTEITQRTIDNYYVDYEGRKILIGHYAQAFEPEKFSIGCNENSKFTINKKVVFSNTGNYTLYANINNVGTQNSITVEVTS